MILLHSIPKSHFFKVLGIMFMKNDKVFDYGIKVKNLKY